MFRIVTTSWLKHIALATSVVLAPAASCAAQTTNPAPGGHDEIVKLGAIARTADSIGREGMEHGVVRVERRNDSVLNGALIGAGSAIATGLLLCRATEPWENCRDDVGPMLKIGALGAGIGIAIDALFRDRKTIYEADSGAVRLDAAPVIGRRGAGLQVTLAF
jgi:hypothetical protein